MLMIRANCRIQFSKEDIQFIISTLTNSECESVKLEELLSDPESLDIILEDRRLLDAMLEQPGCLKISHRLYFYVLVRHVLKSTGIDDTSMADYVAELLAHFASAKNLKLTLPFGKLSMDYLVDALSELQNADAKLQFFIQVFIGNYTLFMTGLFPGRIKHRTEYHAAPGIEYYEAIGKSHYHVASRHRLARHYRLDGIYQHLSESFRGIRLALNDLSRRLMFLELPGY